MTPPFTRSDENVDRFRAHFFVLTAPARPGPSTSRPHFLSSDFIRSPGQAFPALPRHAPADAKFAPRMPITVTACPRAVKQSAQDFWHFIYRILFWCVRQLAVLARATRRMAKR